MIDMFEFVLIEPGTFLMGSPEDELGRWDDEALHEVTITKPFLMQTTPVTQEQWEAVMGNKPSFFKGDNLPVESVSWRNIQYFIQLLNERGEGTYRLPTEAEWEYCCRAGTDTPFGIDNGYDLDKTLANIDGDEATGKPTPVKSFAPNAWGLYDMHGNVWEWCQDRYGEYPSSAVSDPQGAKSNSHRVARGGSWYFRARSARSASRRSNSPGYRHHGLGFRLVKEME